MLPDITAAMARDRVAERRAAAEHSRRRGRPPATTLRAQLGQTLVALGTRLASTSSPLPSAPTISRRSPAAVTMGR